MADNHIDINDKRYEINGTYQQQMVPSAITDVTSVSRSWDVASPLGFSRAAWDGSLATDYADNLDHRYDWLLTSSPARNAVDLGVPGGAPNVLPVADVTVPGTWTEGAGNTNGEAWDEMNEAVGAADDATTYWTTSTNGAEIIFQMGQPSEAIPAKSATLDQFARVARVRNSVTTFTVTITLYEGSTTIAATTSGTLTGTDWQSVISGFSISQAQMDTITDFNNLRVGVQRASGSGDFDLTQTYLTLPDPYFGCSRRASDDTDRIFVDRGTGTAQIDPADMSVDVTQGHGSTITDSIAEWGGSAYIALGDEDLVQKRTIVGAAATATYADVTGVDAFFLNDGPDRVWAVDGGITTAADKNKVKYALGALTSANLSNAFQVADPGTTVTGLYTQGENMVIAHTRGVNSFTSAGKPVRLLEVLRDFPSVDNGRCGGSYWGWLYIGTKLGLYAINIDAKIANPVGPGEGIRGQGFEGPVDGHPTAVFGWKDSLWVSYLTSAGEAYVFQGRFGPETGSTGRPEWFGFRKSDAPTTTRLLGATSLRQNPTLIVGENQDIAWYTLGRRGRDIADADYVFSTGGGDWYGTTLMMPEGAQANFSYAKFSTENCGANDTWLLGVDVNDSGSYTTVGAAVTTDGLQTLRPAATSTVGTFTRIKPKLTQAATSSSAPPQVRGQLTMVFEVRPDKVREIKVPLSVTASELSALETLAADDTTAPIPIRLPTDITVNTDRYAHIHKVDVAKFISQEEVSVVVTIRQWELS